MASFAVVIFVVAPEGATVLVRDPNKPAPVYWKCPGGHGRAGETPLVAARRELREETGLRTLEELKIQEAIPKKGHMLFFCVARVSSLNGLNERGNEGERVQTFPRQLLRDDPDFFPNHKEVLMRHDLV